MLFWCAVLVHEDLRNLTLLKFLKHGFLHAFSWSNITYDLKIEMKTCRLSSTCIWITNDDLNFQIVCEPWDFFMWFFYLQALIKSFLPNLRSTSAVTRRTAASCLVLICEHSRSSASFYNYLLGSLLGEQLYWGI